MAGVAGKSGRKTKWEIYSLAKLMDESWTQKERVTVIKGLSQMAQEGDVKAAALLLAYAYGKPIERHELTGQDGSDLFERARHFQSHVTAIAARREMRKKPSSQGTLADCGEQDHERKI